MKIDYQGANAKLPNADAIKRYMQSGKAPSHAGEFETSFAMAAFPQRVHWEGVDYARIKPLLHIKDPASAAQEEEFAREAKLTGTHMLREALNWSLSVNRRTTGRNSRWATDDPTPGSESSRMIEFLGLG